MTTETVEAEGHLIDSGNLQAILTTVVEHPAEYEILRLDVGRTNESPSRLSLKLLAPSDSSLQSLLAKLSVFGCYVKGSPNAVVRAADMDGSAPEDFYWGCWTSTGSPRQSAGSSWSSVRRACSSSTT